jgi:hypothetical protein
MSKITRPHPHLPFITLCIRREEDEDTSASAWSDGYDLVYPFLWDFDDEASDDEIFRQLARHAECVFFTETSGGFLCLRSRVDIARETGDTEMIALLSEGFGYWRAVQELAPDRMRFGEISFFDKLAKPPTILADYHEQKANRPKNVKAPAPPHDPAEDIPF